jgi:flagellar hook-basal body complex protein FliE
MVDNVGDSFGAAFQQQLKGNGGEKPAEGEGGSNFEEMLSQTLKQTNQASLKSGEMQDGLAAGEHRKIHETMIAAQEASLSFKMVSEVRNKVVDAYREIFRMPV